MNLNHLKTKLYHGLENRNTGFDALSIYHFSAADFEKVLERVEALGLGIYGIEVWLDENFHEVLSHEDYQLPPTDKRWYTSTFKRFRAENTDFLYSATFTDSSTME